VTDVLTGVCRALSHPARRGLLQALRRGECDVGHLSAGSGLDQPTVSKNLATLRRAGLVQVRIDGRRRCYSLDNEEIVGPILDLLAELESQVARQGAGVAAGGD
jgi:DNA-binding transcriptional ArsR family regulator